MNRRHFIKLCGSAAALTAANAQQLARADIQRFAPTLLVDGNGAPIKAAKLVKGTNYLFHYPYLGTPAFLLRLEQPTAREISLKTAAGDKYRWSGGVGPENALVAFSAICPHQLSAALRAQSFLSYTRKKSPVAGRGQVIVCCAHHSVYDPARGGAVLSGPAPQPLTAILLRHNPKDDSLVANGVAGGELFKDFFKAYKRELIDEFGRGAARQATGKTTAVVPLEEYTGNKYSC
jgi:arsenite oxidase small subunit